LSDKKIKPGKAGKKRKIIFKLFIFLATIPLIILTVMVIISLLPGEKTGQWLSARISTSTGLTVQLDEVKINPFERVSLKGISAVSPQGDTLITLESLLLRYKFLPLLSRQIVIKQVEIKAPKVYLPFPANSDTSRKNTGKQVAKEQEPQPLPFAFGLWTFNLESFDLEFSLPDNAAFQKIALTGISFLAEKLYIPRGNITTERPFGGKIKLFTSDGTLSLTDSSGTYFRRLDLDLRLEKQMKGKWQTSCRLGIGISENSEIFKVLFSASGNLPDQKIELEQIAVEVAGKDILDISGIICPENDEILIDLRLDSERLYVRETVMNVLGFLPPAFLPAELDTALLRGWIEPMRGRLSGRVDSLIFAVDTHLAVDSIQAGPGGPCLHQIDGNVSVSGLFFQNELSYADLDINLSVARLAAVINDSTEMQVGPFNLDMTAKVDTSMLPVEGKFSFNLDSVLKGRAGAQFSWKLPESQLAKINLSGRIFAQELDLATNPLPMTGVEGKVNFNTDIEISNLAEIKVNSLIQTPGITWVLADRLEKTQPLSLSADMQAAVSNDFSHIFLNSFSVKFESVFEFFLTGIFEQNKMLLTITEFGAFVHNDQIKPLLPESINTKMLDLTFSGQEAVTGNLKVDLSGPEPKVTTGGRFRLIDVSFQDAASQLKLNSIGGVAEWQMAGEEISGNLNLVVNGVELPGVLAGSLDSSAFSLGFQLKDGIIDIIDGDLQVPDLALRGGFRARIDSVNGKGHVSAEGGINFKSDQTVLMPGGLGVQGLMNCRFACNSLDSLNGVLAVSGELAGEKINIALDTTLNINDVRLRLPFKFDFSLPDSRLVESKSYRPISPIAWEDKKDLYRQLMPELGFLKIVNIKVPDYIISDVNMDIRLGNNWLEIPGFETRFLDGNLGGMMRVNFGAGSLQDITYEIQLQAARINSAALLDVAIPVGESTELNAVLSFNGTGVDPNGGIDLQGYFNITKIGPRFASTLLHGMDPEEKDRSIRLTRKLLNMGWKPRLFSFEARHGYIYPSLSLDQPWFSPIRLPEKLEFGRLPIEFFLAPALK